MKNRMPRKFYIPKGAMKVADKNSTAVAYVYDASGKFYALGFHGRADKPDFHYRYSNPQKRADAVAQFFAGQQAQATSVAKRREERKAPHSLKPGDILDSHWGYGQTNIDFYEVVQIIGDNSVKICKIAQALAKEQPNGPSSERVVPVPGKRIGEPFLKRASKGNYVRIDNGRGASPWSGKPVSQTAFGWGH